jgi:16S rRNA (cytosine967-C5)-methyltransferase
MNDEHGDVVAAAPRLTAAGILRRWRVDGRFPDREMEAVRSQRALVTELVYGTVRLYRRLEALRAMLVPRLPAQEVDVVLLLGLYQVLYLDRVPAHALVHETVEAAKQIGGAPAARLTNAVLRRALRERTSLLEAVNQLPPGPRLSHPDLLITRWTAAYGEEVMTRLCEWDNQRPAVTLYLRPEAAARVHDRARAEGVELAPHPADPDRYVVLPHGIPVHEAPGFAEGACIAQDPAAFESVQLLDVQPGQLVLDLCAAPGGKTIHLADALAGQGRLIAADRHADRLPPLRENLARTSLAAEIRLADAGDPRGLRKALGLQDGEAADRILLDVPCTNTGVLQRRADARWRFTAARLRARTNTQRRILSAAAPLLRPGGVLVYSTCSLEPEENEDLVRGWTAEHPEFRLTDERRRFPPRDHCDGAYAARLVRG